MEANSRRYKKGPNIIYFQTKDITSVEVIKWYYFLYTKPFRHNDSISVQVQNNKSIYRLAYVVVACQFVLHAGPQTLFMYSHRFRNLIRIYTNL